MRSFALSAGFIQETSLRQKPLLEGAQGVRWGARGGDREMRGGGNGAKEESQEEGGQAAVG